MAPDHAVPPESPFALLTPEQVRAWYAYMKLQLRLRYEMNRQLRADSGISLADFDVLVALTSAPDGRMRMAALATRIGWERSRTSHHVRTLAQRELVATGRAADDGRATDVALTAAGRDILRDASPQHVDLVRRMFFEGLAPAAVAEFAGTLETVYEKVIEHGTLPRPDDHP